MTTVLTYNLDTMDCYSYREIQSFDEFDLKRRFKLYQEYINEHRSEIKREIMELAKMILNNQSSSIARMQYLENLDWQLQKALEIEHKRVFAEQK